MKAFAKANIFLKLVGIDKKKYHLLKSRFIILEHLYDEIYLSKDKQKEGFEIISSFQCECNILVKIYEELCKIGFKNELEECFKTHSVVLIKNIPTCAGLGGGSSDAASFLKLLNEALHLKIPTQKMFELALKIGADIPFFLSGFKSANVSGIGEIIKEFDDEIPELYFEFPQVECLTKAVYDEFDRTKTDFEKNLKFAKKYEKLKTKDLLYHKNTDLNDLFTSCVTLYPKMSFYVQNDFFLSGSGSSVFKVH